MIFATSSGVPSRCSGICCSTILSVPGDRIAVSISPGAIELTRTPWRPKSDAISRVNEASAAFEVAYAAPANGCTLEPAIEVTLTTEPFAAFNSSISPRAIMIGAKKLTRKTWLQVSMSVSIEPSRRPPSAFGEIAALLTSACRSPPSSRSRISEIARVGSAWSARSTWMWASGPAPHGHSSGNGWREQVMTRQPALEKRITVACPMPRLAPVRSSVRRGVLAEFGINGSLVLRHARLCAGHPRLEACCEQDLDGWDEPGHDDLPQGYSRVFNHG